MLAVKREVFVFETYFQDWLDRISEDWEGAEAEAQLTGRNQNRSSLLFLCFCNCDEKGKGGLAQEGWCHGCPQGLAQPGMVSSRKPGRCVIV